MSKGWSRRLNNWCHNLLPCLVHWSWCTDALVYWCAGVHVHWANLGHNSAVLFLIRPWFAMFFSDSKSIHPWFAKYWTPNLHWLRLCHADHARLARLGFERSGNLSSNMTEILRDMLKSKDIGEVCAKIDDIYLVFKILGPKFAQVVVEPKMARIVGSPSPEWGDSTYNTSSFLHTFFIIRIIWSSSVGK